MIKRFSTFIFAFITALCAMAQTGMPYDYQEVALGKCADGSDLKCRYIPAEGKLKRFTITREMPYMLIFDDGGARVLDKTTLKKIADLKLGSKDFVQINKDGYITCSDDVAFFSREGRPTFYNFKGEKVWSSKYGMTISDRYENVVVCEKKWGEYVAYDMSTGKELWQRTIACSKHYPWADMYIDQHDRKTYYLKGDKLVKLNILTGDTICHSFSAGVKEPTKSRLSIVRRQMATSRDFQFEEASSSLIGNFILTGTHSNIIDTCNCLYVADAKNLYCFDKNLKTLWQTALPDGMGSKSNIRIEGSRVYLINYGVAFQKETMGRCGKPFIASYDKSTGEQRSLDKPEISKKVQVGIYVDGRAYWQTAKGFLYNDEGDSTIHEISWKPKTDMTPRQNYPDFVICDTVGIVKDGMFIDVPTNKHQLVVEVYGRDVNVIQSDGTCELIPSNEVYFHDSGNVYSTNNGSGRPNDFVIVDPTTRKVKYSFHNIGGVMHDKDGNIFVGIKQGVGVYNPTNIIE